MRQGALVAVVAALICGLTAMSAQADTLVLGGGFAEACSQAAIRAVRADELPKAERPKSPPISGEQACNRALTEEFLSRRDMAATHVNRGVLMMGRADFDAAQADFDTAVSLKPDLAEAQVNRGGALISRRLYKQGVEAINLGLALAPDEPEKAYYNRAMAYEALDDLKAAYFDYLKASELKPEWPLPQIELVRFRVTRR